MDRFYHTNESCIEFKLIISYLCRNYFSLRIVKVLKIMVLALFIGFAYGMKLNIIYKLEFLWMY